MHVSAMGKALLAASESMPDELKPFTKNSITSRRRLLTELETVREQNCAVNDGERDLGVRTIAAVVSDARDHPVAALALQAPSVRLTTDLVPRLAKEVIASAERISRRWHADGPGGPDPANSAGDDAGRLAGAGRSPWPWRTGSGLLDVARHGCDGPTTDGGGDEGGQLGRGRNADAPSRARAERQVARGGRSSPGTVRAGTSGSGQTSNDAGA